MNRQPAGRRCIPVSIVVFISVCALLIGAVSAQAATAASPVSAPGTNAVSASVRSVQPAISGLFQVHTPRVWADVIDESGKLGKNNVPDFLDTWEAFRSRSGSANLNGNFYAFLSRDGMSHEILYAGVQRSSVGRPSEVTFELSQKTGERLLGDLRIVAEIDAEGGSRVTSERRRAARSSCRSRFSPTRDATTPGRRASSRTARSSRPART